MQKRRPSTKPLVVTVETEDVLIRAVPERDLVTVLGKLDGECATLTMQEMITVFDRLAKPGRQTDDYSGA